MRRARWAFSRSQTTRRGRPISRRKCRRARIATWLETLPRTCRAYNRPAGVTATTLDTSRRLLSRRSTGAAPRRAQVVPGRARKLCPVSSRKTMVRPSRRARFFDGGPVAARPGGDRALVALPRPGGRALHRKAERLQRPLQVARMMVHPELPPDQRRDAPQGPSLGLEAGRHRPPRQQPAQARPVRCIEARRPAGRSAGALASRGGPLAPASPPSGTRSRHSPRAAGRWPPGSIALAAAALPPPGAAPPFARASSAPAATHHHPSAPPHGGDVPQILHHFREGH